jgi:hypothetical protein
MVGIAAALLTVGLGFGLLRRHPDDAIGVCCFPPFAAVVALFGVAHLRTRVEVGPGGVAKRPWVLGGFAVGWPAVEWWSVVNLRREDAADTFSDRAVRFAVGWRRFEVRESEVHRPGFEPFLADVRAWAGCRERIEPDATEDGGA